MEIKSEIDCGLQATDLKSLYTKSGEIFVKTDETFNIVCTSCNISFTEFIQFNTHCAQNHSDEYNTLSDGKCDQIEPYDGCPEFMHVTTHAYNHSDNYNNLSDGECDQIDPIKIEPYDGFSHINSNCSVSEINQCTDGVPNIIDSNINVDTLLNESTEIVKSKIMENKESVNNDSIEIDPTKCRYCDRKNSSKFQRIIHERRHTGEKPFKCELCDKLFSAKKGLRKHEKVHTGIIQYHCDLCEKIFSSGEKVEKHKKHVHLSLDPFVDSKSVNNDSIEIDPKKCRYCDRKCSSKSLRIIHEREHTGEKPYKCGFCDKQFTYKQLCDIHERVHSGIKPFQCDICNISFADRSNLILHRRRHIGKKPFKCQFCDKLFSSKKNFKEHEKVHTGNKQLNCDLGEKKFSSEEIVEKHKKFDHLPLDPFVDSKSVNNDSIEVDP